MNTDAVNDIATVSSPRSVAETVARLTQLVASKGLTLFAVIDHSGGAADVGLEMPDTKLIIFGDPRAGTPVMIAAPLAAFDLPLRVLVHADAAGNCQVSYLPEFAFAARYRLTDDVVAPLEGVTALVEAAVAP